MARSARATFASVLGRALLAFVLLAPPLALGVMAVPRFAAGLRAAHIDGVVSDRLSGYRIKPAQSRAAESALASALPADGDSEIWRAELIAVRAAGDGPALKRAATLARDGLRKSPASARGWTLLCELDMHIARAAAPSCMDTAFYVGPFDWFVAERRTILSAYLFPQLDPDTKAAAARRLRLVWNDAGLRWVAYEAAEAPNGAALVVAAFEGDAAGLTSFEHGLALWRSART